MTQRKARYEWRVVSENPCDDCAPRQGSSRTLAQWAAMGLPGSGWSICQSYCKCELQASDPSGLLRGTPPVSREPIRPGDMLTDNGYDSTLKGRERSNALRAIGRGITPGARKRTRITPGAHQAQLAERRRRRRKRDADGA